MTVHWRGKKRLSKPQSLAESPTHFGGLREQDSQGWPFQRWIVKIFCQRHQATAYEMFHWPWHVDVERRKKQAIKCVGNISCVPMREQTFVTVRPPRKTMLVTKTHYDIPSRLDSGRPIRIYVISPNVPDYPQAKFPGKSCSTHQV